MYEFLYRIKLKSNCKIVNNIENLERNDFTPLPHLPDRRLNQCDLYYLYIELFFISVAKGKSNVCRHKHDVRLQTTSGFIATITATETGLGTTDCPWVLSGTAGQQISLSVLDFGTVTRDGEDRWVPSNYNARNCPVHLVVHDGSATSRTPLCGAAGSRERHLMRSKYNKVRMHMTIQMSEGTVPHFLVRYKGRS